MEYSKEEKFLIALSRLPFFSALKFHKMLEYFGDCSEIIDAVIKNGDEVRSFFTAEQIEDIIESFKTVDNFIQNLEKSNVFCCTYISKDYSLLLKQISDFPIVLYCKGDISLLSTKCFAIVGSRTPTNYGKGTTHNFSKNLARSGLTIVSGLSMGVDKISHEACLEVRGKTIAVLGGGFNKIYPSMNFNLANEIATKGLLLSEYPPSASPTRYTFPARNRIIAGLSLGTLITEAGEKSGSLYTKEYTLDYNRNLYLVPGNITSPLSKELNRLIKTCQGFCVLSFEDILSDLGFEKQKLENVVQLSINEKLILDIVEKEETHFDTLLSLTNLEPKILNSCLTTMCIRGIIRKLAGNFYSV